MAHSIEFMAAWQDSILSSVKTHLEFAEKHLKDPQTVRNKIIWSDEPQFQVSCLKGTRYCSSQAEYITKEQCAVSAHAVAGTEGLVRVEEKLNAPKY